MTMPQQKPGKSEQVVCTPPEFLAAVRKRLGIQQFAIDLAASEGNNVCPFYFTKETDSLSPIQPWVLHCGSGKGYGWLNPPFAHLAPWVEKCWMESRRGAEVALLVPNSPGAKWWNDSVRGKGYVTNLTQRIKFVGHEHPYIKDLALVLYAPYLEGGDCTWRWNAKEAK